MSYVTRLSSWMSLGRERDEDLAGLGTGSGSNFDDGRAPDVQDSQFIIQLSSSDYSSEDEDDYDP